MYLMVESVGLNGVWR